jgi:hypothetical protein
MGLAEILLELGQHVSAGLKQDFVSRGEKLLEVLGGLEELDTPDVVEALAESSLLFREH